MILKAYICLNNKRTEKMDRLTEEKPRERERVHLRQEEQTKERMRFL